MLRCPTVLVVALSTPSTAVRAQPSGSNALGGTFHKAQTGHTAGSFPPGAGGLGDRGVPQLGCAGQPFHLPATCDPMHTGNDSRDCEYHSIEDLW
jgi:hypothetical protein